MTTKAETPTPAKRIRYNAATGDAVIRAYNRASLNMSADDGLLSTSVSAGYIVGPRDSDGDRTGYQVFVKVCRYSEALLKSQPETGGLLCEVK